MGERQRVALVCDVCGARNYKTTRGRNTAKRLEINKFCATCKRHTLHRESK
jgi:large subunit ribosomal protein L33